MKKKEDEGYEERAQRCKQVVEEIYNSTGEDFLLELAELIDNDGDAGPLWEAFQIKAKELAPELFGDHYTKELMK